MRTLELNEIEQVAGGLLPVALVPLIKAAAPVVATVVTAVVAASVVRDALEEAAKLCSEGADVTVKPPVVELSCSAKKDGQGTQGQGPRKTTPPPGMLKAMLPEFIGA
jgi:hypothetical protein